MWLLEIRSFYILASIFAFILLLMIIVSLTGQPISMSGMIGNISISFTDRSVTSKMMMAKQVTVSLLKGYRRRSEVIAK